MLFSRGADVSSEHVRRLVSVALCLQLFLSGLALHAQTKPSEASRDYLNPSLPVERRVNDLVGRMTLEEKVAQMMNRAPAIERLGVPEYEWWNEGLHGVVVLGARLVRDGRGDHVHQGRVPGGRESD